MEVTSTGGQVTTTATKSAEAAATSGGVAGDFETFLKLLTTQMQNQDPMKPTESTEFVAQLASFSGVEQQVRANDRLDAILAALGGGTSAGLAEWIGREVRAPGSVSFAGAPVEAAVTPEAAADRAVLVVRNDFDQVVARRSVDPAAETVTWDGLDELGSPAAHGSYRLSLESYKGETLLGSQDGLVYATVREVRLVEGIPRLVLDGGEQVALEDVAGVR